MSATSARRSRMTRTARPRATTSRMSSSRIVGALKVHNFKLMGQVLLAEETPMLNSDAKPQSNIKQRKEVVPRTTLIKSTSVVFLSRKRQAR